MSIKNLLFKQLEMNILDSLPEAIIFCDKEGKIIWVNDKAIRKFSVSKSEIEGTNIKDYIEDIENLLSVALTSTNPILVKKINEEFYFDMAVNVSQNGYTISLRENVDVNNINDEDLEYAEINREKNNFLLKIANDLKAPLQSVIGFSQAMSDGLGGNVTEQQEKYIRIIRKNSTDLMYFIEKMLEFSASEIDKNIPELKIFDVVSMLTSVTHYVEQLNKDKNIRFQIDVEDGLKNTIISNQEILKMCIQNILEVIVRAIDFGDIKIAISLPQEDFLSEKHLIGEYLLMSFSSSALLLTENELDSMFDPYKILDSTNRKNLLRAMILASVRNFAKKLNAEIFVEFEILKSTSINLLVPLNFKQENQIDNILED